MQCLSEILPSGLMQHPDYCHSQRYVDWEKSIAEPALHAGGWQVVRWWSTDADSFGPLARAVEVKKDGQSQVFSYG